MTPKLDRMLATLEARLPLTVSEGLDLAGEVRVLLAELEERRQDESDRLAHEYAEPVTLDREELRR